MSTDNDTFARRVAEQQEQILQHLARLGLTGEFSADIPDPDPDSPLAEILVATRIVAENLVLTARERDESLRQLQEKVQTIERQAQAILELSTPVIQVWDDILVMPLIGTIDTSRAQQVLENLLGTVARKNAAVVIIDITGVPVVDSKVADHFLKTIAATRLLGAEVLLTGLSPHNAQALVRLGVSLTGVKTQGTLQAGLRVAFELTHHRITREGQGGVRR